ncbi:MAG TPA: histone-like nucleoid-structuring protein Lsr2 [Kribbella sp.]|nr:histone-like nucleoid-structuring protein Lsr2 [Kribbella sp.]
MATEFPVTDEEIVALRVKLLRALASSTYPKESIGPIAANHKVTVDDVKSLVDGYGYPDKKMMAQAALELAVGGNPKPASPQQLVARRTAPPPDLSKADPPGWVIESVLADGEKASKARTRRLAVKIREQIAELRGLVNSEREEKKAAEKAAAEKARLLAEVKELEEQLAAKKAALRTPVKKASGTPAAKSDNAAIRAWAATQDMECPGFGRVPAAVREAYEAALSPEAGQ